MNKDKIAYLVIDNGIEGRSPDRIVFASYDQTEQKDFYNKSANKPWFRLDKKIINVEETTEETLNKIDSLDALLLETYKENNNPLNEDKIVYLIVDNSEEGEGEGVARIVYATYSQEEQEDFYSKSPRSMNWFIKMDKTIINEEEMTKKLLNKMDGLDKLVLSIPS